MKLWSMLGSSSATVLGRKVYGSNAPRWIRRAHRQLERARTAIWSLRHRFHPKHRYHVVRTGLEPGYHDFDTRMLYACMSLLSDYVECLGTEEEIEERIRILHEGDPNAPEGLCEAQANAEAEALSIYRWWKHDRPANHQHMEDWCQKLFGGKFEKWVTADGQHRCGFVGERDESMGTCEEYWDYEDRLVEDDQKMLHRLIEIRMSLWT